MNSIIGILGFQGSGKDTVGDYLVKHHGYTVDSFANPLKDLLSTVFGWDRSLLEGSTKESRAWRETPDTWWEERLNWIDNQYSTLGRFTPRVAMQVFGTDVMRKHFDDNIWIKSLEYRIKDLGKVVITDCRFPNECQLINQMGGKVLRVKRGDEPVWFQMALDALNGEPGAMVGMSIHYPNVHISDWAWLKETYSTIDNAGSLDELYEKVEWILKNSL